MRIEITSGKYGENDKIILFTSTNKNNEFREKEPITIFKLGLLVNQLAYNELQMKKGYKKRLIKRGDYFFFEEAIKEAIEMAKKDINWAESQNLEKIKDWGERWSVDIENIEARLKRTFQKSLVDFE